MRVITNRCTTGLLVIVAMAAFGQPAHAVPWGKVVKGLAAFDTQLAAGQENYLGKGNDMVFVFPGPLFQETTALGLTGLDLENLGLTDLTRLDVGLVDMNIRGRVTTGVGYTTRILPSISFASTTSATPLQYVINVNTGYPEAVKGELLVNNSGNFNLLGYYRLHIDMSNRGTGFGDRTLDFDVGPIDISGNIFVDLLHGTNPIAKAQGQAAAKANVSDADKAAIRAKVASGQLLSEDELQSLVAMALTEALFGEPPSLGVSATALVDGATADGARGTTLGTTAIPEPATILFMAGVAFVGLARRPRRVR